jgi:uncharacterized membrane protein
MDKKLAWKVLIGAALIALVLAVANNLLNSHSVEWLGSPQILPKPEGWPTLTFAQGVGGGLKFAWKGFLSGHAVVSAVILLSVILVFTLNRMDGVAVAPMIRSLLRAGLGLMFIAAALPKFSDPKDFANLVAQYQMLPAPLVDPFALCLAAFEIVVGLGLLFTSYEREFSLLVGLLLLMFVVALSQALARGLGIACGCFDIEGAADAGETWFSLIRDVVLLFPVGWLVATGERRYLWGRND